MACRRFTLERSEDVSGVSGTGTVAEWVEFSDGTVVLRWVAGEHHSTVVWPDVHSVEVIHGHDGRTMVQFLDDLEDDDDQSQQLAFTNGAEQEGFRCDRCGADRFVSVSLDGGYTRIPQCVPCGAYRRDYYGHGWKASGGADSGWTKREDV